MLRQIIYYCNILFAFSFFFFFIYQFKFYYDNVYANENSKGLHDIFFVNIIL